MGVDVISQESSSLVHPTFPTSVEDLGGNNPTRAVRSDNT